MEVGEDRIKNWGSNLANITYCEEAGYLSKGTMLEMKTVVERGLSADIIAKIEQQYQTSLKDQKIYSRRTGTWSPMDVTTEFCGGYKH